MTIQRKIGVKPEFGTCVAGNYSLPISTKLLAQQVQKAAKQQAEADGRSRPTMFDVYAAALEAAALVIAAGGNCAGVGGTPLTEHSLVYIPNDTHTLLSVLAVEKQTTLQQLVPAALQLGLEILSGQKS